MFTMIMQNRIGYCNPFMPIGMMYSPRMNFLLGFSGALSGINHFYNVPMFGFLNNFYSRANFNPFSMINNFQNTGFVYNSNASCFNSGNFGLFNSVPSVSIPTFNFNYSFPSETSNNSSAQGESSVCSEGKLINKKGEYGKVFLDKVKEISRRINCNYRDLLAVMNAESGINSQAVNKSSGATGLIQFMPKTAQSLGTTTQELKNMSPIKQLDYVEKYLVNTKKNAGFASSAFLSGGQLYALVFLPARAKREVLTDKDEIYYKANKCLDINNDGKITKSELDKRVKNFAVSDKSFLA